MANAPHDEALLDALVEFANYGAIEFGIELDDDGGIYVHFVAPGTHELVVRHADDARDGLRKLMAAMAADGEAREKPWAVRMLGQETVNQMDARAAELIHAALLKRKPDAD